MDGPESLRKRVAIYQRSTDSLNDAFYDKLMKNIYKLMENAADKGCTRLKLESKFNSVLENDYQYNLTDSQIKEVASRLRIAGYNVINTLNCNDVVIWE